MLDIGSTIEKIETTLRDRGALSSAAVLEELRKLGASPETASTAIAVGSQSGAFTVDRTLHLSLNNLPR